MLSSVIPAFIAGTHGSTGAPAEEWVPVTSTGMTENKARYPTIRSSRGNDVRHSMPLSVTTTSSSILTPASPER